MILQQFLHNFPCSISKTIAKQLQVDLIYRLEAKNDHEKFNFLNFNYQLIPLLFQYDFERNIREDSKFSQLTQMVLVKEALSKSASCPLKHIEPLH